MNVLSDRNADQAEVDDAGIQLFLYMYGRNRILSQLLYLSSLLNPLNANDVSKYQ